MACKFFFNFWIFIWTVGLWEKDDIKKRKVIKESLVYREFTHSCVSCSFLWYDQKKEILDLGWHDLEQESWILSEFCPQVKSIYMVGFPVTGLNQLFPR